MAMTYCTLVLELTGPFLERLLPSYRLIESRLVHCHYWHRHQIEPTEIYEAPATALPNIWVNQRTKGRGHPSINNIN